MSLYEKLSKKEENLSLVGLGYVGMPIAVEFAKKGLNVIGFDLTLPLHTCLKDDEVDYIIEIFSKLVKEYAGL